MPIPAICLLVVVRRRVIVTLTLVDFAMSPEVGNDREVASTAVDFASECCMKR